MTIVRLVLLVLAVLRLTRFVTTDHLGWWWIRRPAQDWSAKHETREVLRRAASIAEDTRIMETSKEVVGEEVEEYDHSNPFTWQRKLTMMFDCPFCVGFHIGWIVLILDNLARVLPKPLHRLWMLGLGSLALNYVVGHVSHRID